ncbi:MAG: 16S rRNA (guanine(527)-N(7))-methyltransferase RsmG [Chloroflexota bacterium]
MQCEQALTRLVEGARQFGLHLDESQQRAFVAYCLALQEVTLHTNVTAIRDADGIMTTLFLDSLSLDASLRRHLPQPLPGAVRLVDVGSGAGIPGLPLKILYPTWQVTLIESIGKKARFIEGVVRLLGLSDVRVEDLRAEDVARAAQERDSYDVAVARAVAPLATLVELCAPFVRPGGVLLFPKSGDLGNEIECAREAARRLRVSHPALDAVAPEVRSQRDRWIVCYRKLGATPAEFPRRVGLARTQPIAAPNRGLERARPRGRPGQSE